MFKDVFSITDQGLRRENNQDAIWVDERCGLFAIADGMGGHEGGEVASAHAISMVKEIIVGDLQRHGASFSPERSLMRAFSVANKQIHYIGTVEKPELMGMGTTLVVSLLWGQTLHFANVGDSRVYLSRGENLWQITDDHSLVYEQMSRGRIGGEEGVSRAGRNVITRSVGFSENVEVDICSRVVQPEDFFLMCSDGLCGLVSNEVIAKVMGSKESARGKVEKCIQMAYDRGGDDNISIIVMQA